MFGKVQMGWWIDPVIPLCGMRSWFGPLSIVSQILPLLYFLPKNSMGALENQVIQYIPVLIYRAPSGVLVPGHTRM